MTWDQLKDQLAKIEQTGVIPARPSNAQRADWAYGNAVIENERVTREMTERAAATTPATAAKK